MPITLERITHQNQVAIRALTLSGFPTRKIEKIVGVSRNVICAVNRMVPANSAEVDQYKKDLIAESYSISRRSAIRVTDEKLDACSAPQLAMVSGIFIDKARDIEGLNKQIFSIVNVVADCKTTRDKLEAQMGQIAQARARLSTSSELI